jgi:hypothetical protein
MSLVASTTVDLARIQFATTSRYHFLFVPLTLRLAPLVAVMQTLWRRTGNDAWLRLTRFFGTLLLINFPHEQVRPVGVRAHDAHRVDDSVFARARRDGWAFGMTALGIVSAVAAAVPPPTGGTPAA